MDDPITTPPRTGTVQDVRPVPPLDPKDLPENVRTIFQKLNPLIQHPQEGYLKDNSSGDVKAFIGNCNEALKVGQVVSYRDLENNPVYKVIVIC